MNRLRLFPRAITGVLLGLIARVWLSTLRLDVQMDRALESRVAGGDANDDARDVPWVLVFFHGTQWPLLAWTRRRTTSVMVSLSADGAMQARALRILGFRVHRGSSSRGGARGLAAILRDLRRGHDAAFAVDGPRGPYGVVKPGAILAALRSGARLVPMGSASASASTRHFLRAWDRFALALPFARAAVVLGPPLDPAKTDEADLARAILAANDAAEARLLANPAPQGDETRLSSLQP